MPDPRFFHQTSFFTVQGICDLVEGTIPDNVSFDPDNVQITHIASVQEAKRGGLIFVTKQKYLDRIGAAPPSACLVTKDIAGLLPKDIIPVIVEDPYRAFVQVSQHMYMLHPVNAGIHPQACVSGQIPPDVTVGAFTYIDKAVQIGPGSVIGSHVSIGAGVTIGEMCHIQSHVSISHADIGHHCHIDAGTRIGQSGFGFILGPDRHEPVPQLGTVWIGNGCFIGANVTIDRGSIGQTRIEDGVIIDNQVHIAHNVQIGKGCVIVAQCGLSGSVHLGSRVILGGQVGIADHIKIGDRSQISAKSGVIKNVKPDSEQMGYPAQPSKSFLRGVAAVKKLVEKKERRS